jgi:hypothetical protein
MKLCCIILANTVSRFQQTENSLSNRHKALQLAEMKFVVLGGQVDGNKYTHPPREYFGSDAFTQISDKSFRAVVLLSISVDSPHKGDGILEEQSMQAARSILRTVPSLQETPWARRSARWRRSRRRGSGWRRKLWRSAAGRSWVRR